MMGAMDTQSPTYSDDELTASLAEHLASLDRDDSYRVERVLKCSDVETTELVYFEGSGGGSLGPFVRKRIDASVQIGGAYERLFAAQRAGRRFEHLPRIVDCRRVGDELDVVMEYVEGETLEALVGRLGATPDYARGLYPVLCEAVGELHAGFAAAGEPGVPVIHRDLKPSNIIVSGVRYAADADMTFSSLVIIDLGIARVWRDGADADTVKFGTRSYAPPEQFGFGQTSVRSDIYALGALLFFCLTGTDPKPGRDIREQCEAHDIPVSLADVICMAMALDPAKRFASAKALGHAARAAYELCLPAPSPVTFSAASVPRVAVSQVQRVQQPVALTLPSSANRRSIVSPVMSKCARLLSCIPEPVGRIWNGCVYATTLLLLMGSHFAVFTPTGETETIQRGFWRLSISLWSMAWCCSLHSECSTGVGFDVVFPCSIGIGGVLLSNCGSRRSGLCLPSCASSLLSATRPVSSPRESKRGPVWGPFAVALKYGSFDWRPCCTSPATWAGSTSWRLPE